MAKFGKGFVNAATNPAFLGGMMNAFGQIGATPRRRREEEEQNRLAQGLFGMEEAVKAGKVSPELYQTMRSAYGGKITPKNEKYVRGRLDDIQQQASFNSKAEIASIREQMYSVVNSNLPDPEKKLKLRELQQQANQAAQMGRVDPMAVGQLTRDVERDVFSQKQKETEAERIAQVHDVNMEKAGYVLEKMEEYSERGWLRDLEAEVNAAQLNETKMRTDLKDTGMSREAAKAKYGVAGETMWDALDLENKERQLRIQDAQNRLKSGKFDYTDEELTSLGYTKEQIKVLRSEVPAVANKAVFLKATEPVKTNNLSAAAQTNIAKAIEHRVMTAYGLRYTRKDEVAEGKALAAEQAQAIAKYWTGDIRTTLEKYTLEVGEIGVKFEDQKPLGESAPKPLTFEEQLDEIAASMLSQGSEQGTK